MNAHRIIRSLALAVPLATAALTLAPGTAQADDGPIIVLPPPGGDPQGPVIANPTPEPGPVDHDGPDEIANPTCPTHGGGEDCIPDNDGGGNGEDEPADKPGHNGGNQPTGEVRSIALPTRIDAGVAPAADGGLELTWVLAGGALVTASGAAFAARSRARSRA